MVSWVGAADSAERWSEPTPQALEDEHEADVIAEEQKDQEASMEYVLRILQVLQPVFSDED